MLALPVSFWFTAIMCPSSPLTMMIGHKVTLNLQTSDSPVWELKLLALQLLYALLDIPEDSFKIEKHA